MPGVPEPPIRHFCRDLSRETLRQSTREPPETSTLPQSDSAQDTAHLRWRYFALAIKSSQQKIDGRLCTNCGGLNFFVETTGKTEKIRNDATPGGL